MKANRFRQWLMLSTGGFTLAVLGGCDFAELFEGLIPF